MYLVVGIALLLSSGAPPPTVRTTFGTVVGHSLRNGADEFLAIPFAAPPVGDLRLAPTMPWTAPYDSGRLDATMPGPWCAQFVFGTKTREMKGEEDCLTLNIWRPTAAAADEKLPTMLFIPGGAWDSGTALSGNGSALAAEHNCVVVSMQYRLGALGWLALPSDAAAGKTTGNWALLDQQEAMRWVRAQINAFGGDGESLTIFGESSGGSAVMLHLIIPTSAGLFQRAIIQSGVPAASTQPYALSLSHDVTVNASCVVGGAAQRACLRTKSVHELLIAQDNNDGMPALVGGGNAFTIRGWGPSNDGVLLPDDPYMLLSQGKIAPDVAILAGHTTDESNMFIYGFYYYPMEVLPTKNSIGFEALVNITLFNYGVDFSAPLFLKVLRHYSPVAEKDNRDLASRYLSERSFFCGTRMTLQAGLAARAKKKMKKKNAHTVFYYRWNQRYVSLRGTPPALGNT